MSPTSDLHYWRGELDYARMGRPGLRMAAPEGTSMEIGNRTGAT